jgi:hypothetical protein
MSTWVLIPSLVSLRAAFDHECPDRDRASDGAVGDLAHQQESSDHNPDETGRTPSEDSDGVNEVHAIDVDDDLRRPGWTMQMCVDAEVAHQLALGASCPLQNIIYNRRIWSRSWGWTPHPYDGASPHTEHAHFSARYGSGSGSSNLENYRGPWGIQGMATRDDIKAGTLDALREFFDEGTQGPENGNTATSRIGRAAFNQGVPNPIAGHKTAAWDLLQDIAAAVKPPAAAK